MNYGRSKTPTHSMGTPSVYSHMTRSTSNLKSTRSMKSLKVKWYKKPILHDAFIMDIQRASMYTAVYTILLSIFTFVTAIFDLYCYSMAVPGSTHYGYYIISFEFIYVGSAHVRNALIVFALFSLLGSFAVLTTSIMLVMALRKELEGRMLPWLYVFGVFTPFRIFAMVFFAIVNDRIFAYNALMVFFWTIFSALNIYGWLLVYSLYRELSDLTKLEDLAHLRVESLKAVRDGRIGTMASLNASTTHSIAGSRPTTPHSTVSTAPA